MSENVNWSEVETDTGYSLIPNGDYLTELESVKQESIKDTESVNFGKPLYNCQFAITDNRQKGRKVFINFNPATDKSKSRVKALAIATKTALVGSMHDVLLNSMNKEFIANIGVSKGNNGRADSNTIWAFKANQQSQPVYNQFQQAAPPVYSPPVRTGRRGMCPNTGRPTFEAEDGQWYYDS